MQRVVKVLYWQFSFLFAALLVITVALGPGSMSGLAVLQTEDTTPFAPPIDAFNGQSVISLTYQQVDNETFHVSVQAQMENGYIYSRMYYHTAQGWQPLELSSQEWLKSKASASIEDAYADIPMTEGDDLYVGVWACKGVGDEWYCGCTNETDCGHWYVQGIDLQSEGAVGEQCVDEDGDGYGVSGQQQCFVNLTDCDDTDPAINPGATEIPYNGKDDDCSALSRDDDLDGDGVNLGADCDDTNASISPLGTETCMDGIDQDCDGQDAACEQCGEGSIPTEGCTCADEGRYAGFCCDNTFQAYPCGTPEVIFYDGFESGTANTWDYLNPYSQVNHDLSQSGRFSLDLIYSGGGLRGDQYASVSLTPSEHLFYRYFIYFEEDYKQAVEGVELSSLGNQDWSVRQSARQWQGDLTQGRLFLQGEPTDTILRNGQWYCVEEEVDVAQGDVRLWVDDALAAQSALDLSGDIDSLRQGGTYHGSIEDTIHIYVDNVVVSRQRVGCS